MKGFKETQTRNKKGIDLSVKKEGTGDIRKGNMRLSKNYRSKINYYGIVVEVKNGYLTIDQNGTVAWSQNIPTKGKKSWILPKTGSFEALGVVDSLGDVNWEDTLLKVDED